MKKGKRKQNPYKKKTIEIPSNTKVEALSENEDENHHREEFPEKRVNIQTSAQVKQKNPKEFENGSSVISPVNEMEMVKKDHTLFLLLIYSQNR